MTSLVTRRRLSFSVVHLFMFVTGIEYAVVFPTVWEYLQHLGVPPTSTYWIGLTISAMTLTDMISSLVVGRLLDRTKPHIRCLVLFLNCPQVLGSSVYLTATSPIMLLISRLVSGCGKSITIVFLADICRSTSKEERTPILLLFNIAFQIGLMIGPGFNLVLSQIDVETMIGHLNKLNCPGLLMAFLWLVFSFLVAFLYSDLVDIKQKETIERELARAYVDIPTSVTVSNNNSPLHMIDSTDESQEEEGDDSEEEGNEEHPLLFTSADATYPSTLPSRIPDSLPSMSSPSNGRCCSFRSRVDDIHLINSRENIHVRTYGTATPASWSYDRNPLGQEDLTSKRRGRSNSRASGKSNRFIDEAERLMGENSSETSEESGKDSEMSIVTLRSLSEGGDEVLTWRDYWEVLVSEELVALVFIRFVALFCQSNLESIVPPIMQNYFNYGDLANSILYLVAGVELVLVFLVLSWASKMGVSDRKIVAVGLVIMVITLIWLVVMMPYLTPGNRDKFPLFCVGVFFYLTGIPTVCDVGLALYSKLLPDRVQGFGHGTRRFISQIAILLGPLWGSSTFFYEGLIFGVPLGMLLISSVLFIVSFNKMKAEPTLEEQSLLA